MHLVGWISDQHLCQSAFSGTWRDKGMGYKFQESVALVCRGLSHPEFCFLGSEIFKPRCHLAPSQHGPGIKWINARSYIWPLRVVSWMIYDISFQSVWPHPHGSSGWDLWESAFDLRQYLSCHSDIHVTPARYLNTSAKRRALFALTSLTSRTTFEKAPCDQHRSVLDLSKEAQVSFKFKFNCVKIS